MVWFTDADLLDLAGSRSYQRGTGYLTAVRGIHDLPNGVVATVDGTGVYKVRLYDDGGELAGVCDCPYGDEGNFCKHCVAVGLRLLAREDDEDLEDTSGDVPGRNGSRPSRAVGDGEIIDFLTEMDHADLVDLVWRQAEENPTLYQVLRLMAAASAESPDLAMLRSQVRSLKVEWIGYGDEEGYTDQAYAVVNALATMIPQHAALVQPLLRQAVTAVGGAVEHCETECTLITEVAAEAWEVFLRACEAAPPDAVELGRWLADFRLEGPEWPEIALEEYADLLGEAGLNAYWAVLDTANEANPCGYRVRSARQEMMAATGNVDALVACHAEDLSNPDRYVGIARILCDDHRPDEAIEWLERGLAAMAGETVAERREDGLVDLLAGLLGDAGRHADVLALREEHLGRAKTLASYTALRVAVLNAAASGADSLPTWDTLRPRALAVLRQAVADRSSWLAARNLVEALLLEDEVDQAWDLVAEGPCDVETRLAVAARRGRTHPADTLRTYLPVIEKAVAQTNNAGYERAATLLATLRDLPSIGDTDFTQQVDRLREIHRRKPNFLAALRRRSL